MRKLRVELTIVYDFKKPLNKFTDILIKIE